MSYVNPFDQHLQGWDSFLKNLNSDEPGVVSRPMANTTPTPRAATVGSSTTVGTTTPTGTSLADYIAKERARLLALMEGGNPTSGATYAARPFARDPITGGTRYAPDGITPMYDDGTYWRPTAPVAGPSAMPTVAPTTTSPAATAAASPFSQTYAPQTGAYRQEALNSAAGWSQTEQVKKALRNLTGGWPA